MRHTVAFAALAWSTGGLADTDLVYDVTYTVTPDPQAQRIDVVLEIKQPRGLLREVSMQPDPRIVGLSGDGALDVTDGAIRWQPPAAGGSLTWQAAINHRRNGDGFDAWLGPNWGLFRAEDIIPRAATRTLKGALSNTRVVFNLPDGWSVVTEYYGRAGGYDIVNPERRFDQPTGWILLGDIGVRRETIAGMRVAIAAPVGQAVRRMDALALLSWTLPELARLLPNPPDRLTVISAGEPMWRGGLSAPRSLFIHADRPLISENATSTLLHEIMHLALGFKAEPQFDWIVEGLAEYYSLEMLHRGRAISNSRHQKALADQARWGRTASALCRRVSAGATSALAVSIFVELNNEILEASGGTASLDDLARTLVDADRPIGLEMLRDAAETLIGHKSDALHIDKLPGCRTLDPGHPGNQGR